MAETTDPSQLFESQRALLMRTAYRMLGSLSDAEDMVQETYLRWQAQDQAIIVNPAGYLVRICVRLCLDQLKSAYHQRTQYIGPWLPEPVITDNDPSEIHELAEDLSFAFLVLLERLSPTQRAVFLLHDSFAFSYPEIAQILELSPQNCRQIGHRARKQLAIDQPRQLLDPGEHERLFGRFLQAIQTGDVASLTELLAHDAILYSDGGGKVTAARNPIVGAMPISRFLLAIQAKNDLPVKIELTQINQQQGMLLWLDNRLHSCWTIQVRAGYIQHLYLVINPDKLQPIANGSHRV